MRSRKRLSARRNSPAWPVSCGSSASRQMPSIRTPHSIPPIDDYDSKLDILYQPIHYVNQNPSDDPGPTSGKDGMARPREFDEATALEAAIECFWNRGYEATSIRDLADKWGFPEPSLYNTFGDKHALFVQALERYLDHSTRARIKRLEDSCRRNRLSAVSSRRSSSAR